ncbi:MAG: formylglycine-generating enzyme family protein [Deltaproteobacteria bacterium]|nr:formylglycine-generating enzyme family protein [Deltaproteobacteria bacterium]
MGNKKALILMLGAGILAAVVFIGSKTRASTEDYNPATGEPKCFKCHTAETRYNVDYTRDETCVECHGPGLSGKYQKINRMFREELPSTVWAANEDIKTGGQTETGEKEKQSADKTRTRNTHKDMVLVPKGEFTMGADDWWPKSQPAHKRSLKGFYIDKYEVTNARYKTFVDATGRRPPKHWLNGKIPQGRDYHPVVNVSWRDAYELCKWEGRRLPTEAEWEKAARGTDGRDFPWGKEFSKDKANTPQYGHGDTLPVGSFEAGKSPYGAYDMAGNAFEWTDDWFKPYPGSKHKDENAGKTLRGGSWFDCTTYKCGISSPTYNRIAFNPDTYNGTFGFRCAKDE